MDGTNMTEERAVSDVIAIIDAALEKAEATVLRLDVNSKKVLRSGKFVSSSHTKDGLLCLNRHRADQVMMDSPIPSPSQTLTSSSSTFKGSNNDNGKAQVSKVQAHPSLLCLDPEPHELLPYTRKDPVVSSSSGSSKKKKKKKGMKKASKKGIDVFRFPLIGENPYLTAKDSVYSNIDSKNLLMIRNLKDGTEIDEAEVKRMQDYYRKLQTGKKGHKLEQSPSRLSTSIVSPLSGPCSVQTDLRSESDTFTATRLPSSVVTEDETTASTFHQTPSRSSSKVSKKGKIRYNNTASSSAHTTASSKYFKTPTTASSSIGSCVSVDFTAVVKDPKTRHPHSLRVVAKCVEGKPERVYINGKAFGPVENP